MYKDIVFLDGIRDEYLQDIQTFIAEWESESPYIIVRTSGSTGDPKEIKLDKNLVKASAMATGQFFNLQEGETLLMNLSPDHIAGKMMIVRGILHKMKIIVAPLTSNPLKNISDFNDKIDFAAFVPLQVENILDDENSKRLYNQIEKVIIGGAPINFTLEHRIQECDNNNYATFGMTETITHFALRNINEGEEFYRCLPGVEIDVDERGCLVLKKSPSTNKLLTTNDLVEIIEKDKFIWKGRFDNTINSGGIKIHPESVEKEIEYMVPGRRFYLSSQHDEFLGEELVLVVEGPPLETKEETLMLNQMLKSLPTYQAPRTVIYLNEFDETPGGKLVRKKF